MSKKKLRRHNAPWTEHELARVRRMARERMSARQAAAVLGRTVGSVKYKAMVEGIRFHAIEQPRGTQKRRAQRALLARVTRRRHRKVARETARAAA